MEIWDDAPSTPPQTLPPVRGGSVDTLVLLGAIGCLLTIVTSIGFSVQLVIYRPLVEMGLRYTAVGGLVLIGIGLWKLSQRYERILPLLSAIGFFALAGIRAIPGSLLWDYINAFVVNPLLTDIIWRFSISGTGFFACLCGAIGIFLVREDTADWRFALVAGLGFLVWAIVPLVESILYIFFYGLFVYMPTFLVIMIIVSMICTPPAIGSLLGLLYMWNDRFER